MTEAEREAMLSHLDRIARALESLVLHAGLQSSALEELTALGARFFMTRKRKAKRKRRKPRGVAASLVSLVLLTGCGGVVDGGGETNRVEQGPVLDAEGGAVRVEQRDSGVDGQAVECTPDAERTTGVLCEHPKRRGDAG